MYLTFWLATALRLDSWLCGDAERRFTELLQGNGDKVAIRNFRSYVVTESMVMDATSEMPAMDAWRKPTPEAEPKVERLPGWQQIVPLKIPSTISRQQWLDIWLYSHADIACETQSTFGYIHNIVQRTTMGVDSDIDAIVTENFPDAAMSDDAAFYDAVGDAEKLAANQHAMMESCERFIDNSDIAVVPMSAYRVQID